MPGSARRSASPLVVSFCLALALAAGTAACATTISEKDTAAAQVHYDIAVASMGNNDMRGALRDLLAAVGRDPTLPEAHNALGLVYHVLGRHTDAEEHYKKALELKPGFSEAHNNYGTLLVALGRYDEAISAFDKALSDILYQTPFLAEGNLGWAQFKKGDVAQGKKHLQNAVATNPKFCRGYEWLARLFLDTGEGAEVVANIKRFRKHCVDDAAIRATLAPQYVGELTYYLGLGHLKAGSPGEAKVAFAECAALGEDGIGPKCAAALASLP